MKTPWWIPLLLGAWLWSPSASADPGDVRLSIVVGNNGSATLERAELRYADDDAAKYATLLGSTSTGKVELLTRFDADSARLFPSQVDAATPPTRAALDAAVARVAAQAKDASAAGKRVVFTFVFAGHGDVEQGRGFLELEDGRFFREDLEAMIATVPSTVTHVLLDSCNSVYMVASRKPGGTRFATPQDVEESMRARMANVGTFLSTSADAEVFEWSQIESGVFSHVVRSGLAGAADLNGDGRITYGELRAFARVAVEGIPNPRFRPRIYARGPGGRDDEVLFETRAAASDQKFSLAAGPERRVTMLDDNEVPLVDVRLERGFGATVVLPASGTQAFTLVEQEGQGPLRRTALAKADPGGVLIARADAPPSPAARGSRSFELLFAAPFGPNAVAALPAEDAAKEVYGVSIEERERMRRLLEAAGGYKRDERIALGVIGTGLGVAFAGFGASLLATPEAAGSSRDGLNIEGGVFLGAGAFGLGYGLFNLLTTSSMEDRRDEFVAALHARPEAFDVAVRNAENQLSKEADAQRGLRKTMGYLSAGVGGLLVAVGVAAEVAANGESVPNAAADLRWAGGMGLAFGAGEIVLGLGMLAIRSEPERLWDLWSSEPSTVLAPRPNSQTSLRLRPMVGLGSLGLAGTF
jgi:hypothetical protein